MSTCLLLWLYLSSSVEGDAEAPHVGLTVLGGDASIVNEAGAMGVVTASEGTVARRCTRVS